MGTINEYYYADMDGNFNNNYSMEEGCIPWQRLLEQ